MDASLVTPSLPQCPTGTLLSWSAQSARIAPAWCKRWACPECGRRKAFHLAERITATTAKRFVTLTMRLDPLTPSPVLLDQMNKAWRSIWKRYRRRFGLAARGYVRIVELTKNGAPHLHIAVDAPYISQKELSKWWREKTGSFIVDVRRIHSTNGIARYLAKYLVKAHDTLPHRRKWSQSADFLPPNPTPPEKPQEGQEPWWWAKAGLSNVANALRAAGWLTEDGFLFQAGRSPPRALPV